MNEQGYMLVIVMAVSVLLAGVASVIKYELSSSAVLEQSYLTAAEKEINALYLLEKFRKEIEKHRIIGNRGSCRVETECKDNGWHISWNGKNYGKVKVEITEEPCWILKKLEPCNWSDDFPQTSDVKERG